MAAVKKVGQKNGEVGLLVEYLFCDRAAQLSKQLSKERGEILNKLENN